MGIRFTEKLRYRLAKSGHRQGYKRTNDQLPGKYETQIATVYFSFLNQTVRNTYIGKKIAETYDNRTNCKKTVLLRSEDTGEGYLRT